MTRTRQRAQKYELYTGADGFERYLSVGSPTIVYTVFGETADSSVSTTDVMVDELETFETEWRSAAYKQMQAAIKSAKSARAAALDRARSEASRQISQAIAAIKALDLEQIAQPIHIPTASWVSRKDFPSTLVPPQWLSVLYQQALWDCWNRADAFYQMSFAENLLKTGYFVVGSSGEQHVTNYFSGNRFRKAVRLSQDDFAARLALEQAPEFSGRRLVTVDDYEVKEALFDAQLRERSIWDKILESNALETARLRGEWARIKRIRSARAARLKALVYALRDARRSLMASQQLAEKVFNDAYVDARVQFDEKIRLIEACPNPKANHHLYRYASRATKLRGSVTYPGGSIGDTGVPENPVSWWLVPYGLDKDGALVKFDRDGQLHPMLRPSSDVLDPDERTTVSELMFELAGRRTTSRGRNWLSELFELRDIPKSAASLRRFLSWGKLAYTGRTLKGVTLRSVAESYLEYQYGISPTVSTFSSIVTEFHSFYEWLRGLVDPSTFIAPQPDTVSVSRTMKGARMELEPLSGYVTFKVLQGLSISGPMASQARLDAWNQSRAIPGETIVRQVIDQIAPLLLDFAGYREVEDRYYKVYSRPLVATPTDDEIRKQVFRKFLWDNSLTETFWNWVPFSFMFDWFFSIKDVLGVIDRVAIIGYNGLSTLAYPWYRLVRDRHIDIAIPSIKVGSPQFVENLRYGSTRYPPAGSSNYWEVAWVERLYRVPWSAIMSSGRIVTTHEVLRDECPPEHTALLDSLKARARRAIRFRGGESRAMRISPQVLALGVANRSTVDRTRIPRPSSLTRGAKVLASANSCFGSSKIRIDLKDTLKRKGFVLR